MAAYLAAIFAYGCFAFAGVPSLLKGGLIVILYALFDLAWTRLRDKIWYFPLSSFISGLVLAIVSRSDLPIWLVVLLPLLAVFSKQLLHFGKMRHLMNPAAFAMAVMSFFTPTVTWWATSWSLPGLIVIAIVSIFILWKQERWHVALPFLLSYPILLSLFLLITGVPFQSLQGILTAQLITGTLLFFSTVMLIEPMTSTFPMPRQRSVYGLLVAIFAVLLMTIFRFIHLPTQDPLILGLICGNLLASLLFLPNRNKLNS